MASWREWLRRDESRDPRSDKHGTHPWYLVIWLTGVDYFSTLGYQPGIALLAAGALSPIATAVLVAVTLLCALPIYVQVAGRSFAGLGSIAMLENLLPGWWGKFMVLVLLGFATTDFVITMTLSASDAARHATENPYLHPFLGHANLRVTLVLLALLAAVFLKGFKEAIELATAVCVPYLLLNVVVLGRALIEVGTHPLALPRWQDALNARGDWTQLALGAVILFPRLALGLSGFETGVSVMPLIRRRGNRRAPDRPVGRIRNTRKLLATAALIMSVLLLVSSFVSALLIPKDAYREGGPASGRAIAYLAHEYLGNIFRLGVRSFDDSGAVVRRRIRHGRAAAPGAAISASRRISAGVGRLCPAAGAGVVRLRCGGHSVFRANVEAQGGAYATGVLVLMLSAAVAASISLWKEHSYSLSIYCWGVVLVFGYTTVANIIERTDGIIIASFFILFILIVSGISRYWRAKEIRVGGHRFADAESERLWNLFAGKKVNMVPVSSLGAQAEPLEPHSFANYYNVEASLVFVHVRLLTIAASFYRRSKSRVTEEDGQYLVDASQAVAKANAVAYISELLHPGCDLSGTEPAESHAPVLSLLPAGRR